MIILAILFLLGLGLGVVINSLADNLPPNALGVQHAPALPRCHYCGATHEPIYWLALMGFLLRGGQCEHCAAPRKLRHLIVELVTGLSLAYLWGWAGQDLGKFLAAAVVILIFILITIIDLEHRLVLHEVIWPAAVVIGLIGCLQPERGPVKTLVGGLAGYGLLFGMFLLGQLFSAVIARRRGQPLEEIALGGGDVNLALVIGLAVGWSAILFSLVIAILSAGLFSALYLAVQMIRRRYSPFTAIPYGPFLILGALVLYLYNKEFAAFLQWYMNL